MPSSKIVCPECKAALKPAKPVPDGKRVVCPRCKKTFVTPGAVEDDDVVRPAAKKQAAGKQPAAKAAAKKPAAPAPPPEPAAEDEDEGGGTYAFVKTNEVEEEENKPEITYAPDMSIRDLRGPAQAAIVGPSNGLMVAGALAIVLLIIRIAIEVWPFIFSDHVVDHEKYLYAYYASKGTKEATERAKALPKERKDCTAEELALLDEATELQVTFRSVGATVAFLCIIYNGFMIIGAVKMQNVESYGWSMTAAIMGILPFSFWLVSLPYGIWALIALRDEKVIAGFHYKPE
jgi:hypothetical protein